MEKKFQNKWIVALFAIICCALWGSAYPCIKIGYKLFKIGSTDTANQILFAGIRFTLAGFLIILLNSIFNKKLLMPKKSSIKNVIYLALIQTFIQYMFFYMGLSKSSGVKSAIIGGANVFLLVLCSCFVFKQEKITIKKLLGCLLGFLGILLVNFSKDGFTSFTLTGDGFIFLSSICYALSSCMIKTFSRNENPVALSGYQFSIGGTLMIILGIISKGHIHFSGLGCFVLILYMAFISAMSYTLWGILMKYNEPSSVAVYGAFNPIFGTILSSIFLSEGNSLMSYKYIIALVLVTLGILIVNYTQKKKSLY